MLKGLRNLLSNYWACECGRVNPWFVDFCTKCLRKR